MLPPCYGAGYPTALLHFGPSTSPFAELKGTSVAPTPFYVLRRCFPVCILGVSPPFAGAGTALRYTFTLLRTSAVLPRLRTWGVSTVCGAPRLYWRCAFTLLRTSTVLPRLRTWGVSTFYSVQGTRNVLHVCLHSSPAGLGRSRWCHGCELHFVHRDRASHEWFVHTCTDPRGKTPLQVPRDFATTQFSITLPCNLPSTSVACPPH